MINGSAQTQKCLAAYSVFRELYDNNKDVYGILAEFIKDSITEDGKHNFVGNEVVALLDKKYGFQIPEAVIKNAIKRIPNIKKENHQYYIEKPFEKIESLDKLMLETKHHNDLIIKKLNEYIESKIERNLSNLDKNEILDCFSHFILNQSNGYSKYQKLISAFILVNERDDGIMKALNCAKEGVILYSGLQYTPEEFSTLKWDTDLELFLDTEILFSLVGYNGDFSQAIVLDLMKLIREANDKSFRSDKTRKIILYYFDEIQKEVSEFFKAAEHKLGESKRTVETKPAMQAIMDGCKTKADIIEKKVRFDQVLNSWGIIKDDYDEYYTESNHKYYLGGESAVSELKEELSRYTEKKDIEYCLTLLSKINIHRKDKKTTFEKAKYHFLTANGMYHECARKIAVKRDHDAFLTANVDFLTDKIWIKLNKGFSENGMPKSFNVITRAQTVISNQIHTSVLKKYEELEEKRKKNEIDEKTANLSLLEIRRKIVMPESINFSNVEEMLVFTEEGLAAVIEDQKFQKASHDKAIGEAVGLRTELDIANTKLRKFEEKEGRKQRRLMALKKVGKAFILIVFPILIFFGAVVVTINKQIFEIAVSVGALALIGTILGILRFFGYDYKELKNKITNRKTS
jgi:hypothetical protein